MDTDSHDGWLTRRQVAKRLQVPVKTLAKWGSEGCGPPYAVMGKHSRYPVDRLLEWEQSFFDDERRPRSEPDDEPPAGDVGTRGDDDDN